MQAPALPVLCDIPQSFSETDCCSIHRIATDQQKSSIRTTEIPTIQR